MGRIYQRTPGGVYHGYWTDTRGRPRRQALRTRDQKVARARLRELELVATNPAAHSRHSLEAAVIHLLEALEVENAEGTYDSYRKKSRHLIRVIGNVELADIDRDACMTYVQQRKLEG